MSFLTQVATRRMVMASRSAMTQAPRSFSVAARLQKTPVEATKDTIKQVDRKVSDKIVDGIETAEQAAQKVKNTDMAGKVKGAADQAAGKAEEVKGQVAGKSAEVKGKAAGKSEELKGEAKGTAQKAAGKAKGAADQL
ncbi:Lea domain protein [Apiospora kogelbergensis]|uniref:Lea domain protein n=1 Tax=Apiospora kogelbergensis TaxID=1337665 RepID=A0AAW0QG16_9PEZI